MAVKLVCAVAFFTLASVSCESLSANPIRKVVTLLQNMEKQVRAEGEQEQKAYDTYMCWCKTGGSDLDKSISAANTKVPALQSDIEEAEGQLAQTKEDIAAHTKDRDEAKQAMAEATGIRKKEHAAFTATKDELTTNIAAINKAVPAIEKGMAGAFLQTEAASVLRNMFSKNSKLASEGEDVVAFLSGGSGYAPQAGQIVGILKTMGDEMSADLADATSTENAAQQAYDSLIAAKKKEVAALTKMLEEKLEREGTLSVSIAEMKNDLTDTQEALIADKEFLANLDKSCEQKKKEWSERSAMRVEELKALADTVAVLNSDDALELFKKALPSPSFVQLRMTVDATRAKALDIVHQAMKVQFPNNELGFLALALKGKKFGLDKVVSMIDELVSALKKEQQEDDDKLKYCADEFDSSDDKKKALERSVQDLETAIAKDEETISALTDSIAALTSSINALDKSVAEATQQRKDDHASFNDLIAQNTAAVEVLNFAKNRLAKFYDPKLYKPEAKREVSQADRITLNLGGTMAPTAAPGGIAGTGIVAMAEIAEHNQGKVAPPPPPATFGAYAKQSESNNGVMSMINLLIADCEKQMTEARTEEKDAQSDYEGMMKSSATKRSDDSKSLDEQEAAKADAEAALQDHKDGKQSTENELSATNQYISSLHGSCDWLIKYGAARKEARASEVDSLGKARAVLNGADFS